MFINIILVCPVVSSNSVASFFRNPSLLVWLIPAQSNFLRCPSLTHLQEFAVQRGQWLVPRKNSPLRCHIWLTYKNISLLTVQRSLLSVSLVRSKPERQALRQDLFHGFHPNYSSHLYTSVDVRDYQPTEALLKWYWQPRSNEDRLFYICLNKLKVSR